MLWLWLYIAAMFLVALPVAWFGKSHVAGPIFVVWYVGQILYEFGAPEPQTQAVLYSAALVRAVVSFRRDRASWSKRERWAAAAFLPLALISALMPSPDAWWPIYWFACGQLAVAIRPREWIVALTATGRAAAATWALWRFHYSIPELETGAV